jgi:DNA helicase-2/ATP-dependent DNA helicase PcrA
LDAAALADFAAACGERDLAEERRLAYVGATRAAFWLGCAGYWWGNGTSQLGPSAFLEEIRAACESGAGTVACWAPPPEPDAENPALAEPATAWWPATAEGARYDAVREAGGLVAEAIAAGKAGDGAVASGDGRASDDGRAEGGRSWAGAGGLSDARSGADRLSDAGSDASSGAGGLSDADQAMIAAWARDTSLLLAEREQRRGEQSTPVWLPRRIPVSSLVTMAGDPAELARQVRRPMPRPPAPHAHRGTEFHRWLEERFGPQRLIDPGDLPGAADDEPGAGADPELAVLQQRFESGEWAGRWPAEVEVPFETLIGDRLVRGRIDAVFADSPDGGFDVVDWKTGRQPGSAAESRAAAVQLAAYRLAWAALVGVPVGQVRAAFYYVRDDATVRPADLLDLAGLTALIEDIPLGQ